MDEPTDRLPGEVLVARLVQLEPTGGQTRSAAHTDAYKGLFEHAHDKALLSDPAGNRWLAAMTAHPVRAVRTIAISALAEVPDPAHQTIMVRALSDPDPAVVGSAVRGLTAQTVAEVFDHLVALVNRPGPTWAWPRRHAGWRIAESPHPRRLGILADALAHADNGGAHDIAHALARAGDPRFAPALIEHLRSRAPGGCAVAFALGHLRVADATGPLVDALHTADVTQTVSVLEALAKIGADEAAPAVHSMLDHRQAFVREAALLTLARLGGALVVPAALAAADDGDPAVRERAIRVLAEHGDHRALGRLAAACDGRHVRVALKGLLRLAEPSVAPTLSEVLVTTTDRRTRKLAGQALARIGAPPHLPTWHRNRVVRRAAVWVVGQRADAKDAQVLLRALQDEDELVRARAAFALGRIPIAEALTPLTEALDDTRPGYARMPPPPSVGSHRPTCATAWQPPCSTRTRPSAPPPPPPCDRAPRPAANRPDRTRRRRPRPRPPGRPTRFGRRTGHPRTWVPRSRSTPPTAATRSAGQSSKTG